MFNEGIHIEDVTGVILLRPTVSPIIYYQQIGRSLQAGNDNAPTIFDLVNNFDNIGAKDFINDLENEVKKENDKLKGDKAIGDNNRNYVDISDFMIFDEILEVKSLFENIEDKLFDNWDSKYEQLKRFIIENGHMTVLLKDSISLVYWIKTQRKRYFKNILKKDRFDKLNNINFAWDILDENWEKLYLKLKDYKNINGNCNITRKDITLLNWINHQKAHFKKNTLSDEKILKLKKIDDNILVSKISDWETNYEKYVNYINIYNTNRVSRKINEKLYRWEDLQRSMKKNNELSSDQIKLLDKINFVWNVKLDCSLSPYHLKNLLAKNEMVASELSKLINVATSTIYTWNSGRGNIGDIYLPIIAEIFKIDPNLLEPQKRN